MAAVSYSAHDGSDIVAAYWPLFERQARRFDGVKGAEFDDLVQEAALAGWYYSIRVGLTPTIQIVERACLRYVRSLNTGGWRLIQEGP